MKQLELPLKEPRHPFWCPHELEVVDMSDNGTLKSCCNLTVATVGHPTWTNCRTWGKCTLRGDAL